MEEAEIKAKIAEIRQRYTKLALTCKAAGIRVNTSTIDAYLKELQQLQQQLN